MKLVVLILLSLGLASTSFAGYDCKSADGRNQILIEELWVLGLRATVQSAEISQYYRFMNLNVRTLKSLADHQTLQPINQVLPGGYLFLMSAPNSGSNNVWSMEFQVLDGVTKAVVTDVYGKQFDLKVKCKEI